MRLPFSFCTVLIFSAAARFSPSLFFFAKITFSFMKREEIKGLFKKFLFLKFFKKGI